LALTSPDLLSPRPAVGLVFLAIGAAMRGHVIVSIVVIPIVVIAILVAILTIGIAVLAVLGSLTRDAPDGPGRRPPTPVHHPATHAGSIGHPRAHAG
jgi:hypothetical protein